MINLYKQDLLNQLSDDEYQLWCHDLAVIKRVVTMITSFKSFEEVFLNTNSYYIPDYWKDGNLKYVDHYQPYRNLADLADNFLYGISVMDRVEKYYPLEYYPLHLRVFIDWIEQYTFERTQYNPKNLSRTLVERLNDCIYDIRQDMKSLRHTTELKRMREQSLRQKRSMEKYIDQLLLRFSRLIAIRVDFGYREDAEASYELISEHREKLLRYLRERHCGDAFAGFIWKLEYGLRKSYHLHTMIFLDGSKVQESISHGKLIGQHWIDEITEGEGVTYNCNAHMDKYQHCGLGRVDYHDRRKVENLKYACRYLTKYDEFLELVHYGYQAEQHYHQDDPLSQQITSKLGRVFGTARLPPYVPQLGRPRSKK